MLRRQPYISFPEKGCYTYVIAAATAAVGLFIFLPVVASLYYKIHGLNFFSMFPPKLHRPMIFFHDIWFWTETGFKGDLFMKLLLHIMMEENNGCSPFSPAFFRSR